VDARALRRWGLRGLTLLGLGAGLWALLLLARSAENSANFNHMRLWILSLNLCGVLVMGVLLARKLWRLYRDFRDHVPGSRLTARTVGMFGTLVVVPLLIVYLFALAFLNYGIDSWFRVEVKQGLNDAVMLSRSALDLRLRGAEIVVTGPQADRLAQAALKLPFLDRIVLRASSAAELPAAHPAQEKLKAAPESAAFICVGATCSLPVTSPDQIASAVMAMRGS